jgi:hypothetical protein
VAEVLRKAVPALGAALALAVAGCGAGAEDERAAPAPRLERASPVEAPAEKRCRPGRQARLGNGRLAYAAQALGRVAAFARPGGRPLREFGRENVNGVRTVFGVFGLLRDRRCNPAWYRVQLPVRPNGAIGWVRAEDVLLLAVRTRIEVDLSERRIEFFRDGHRVLRARAAIGSTATPTPTGRYYVNQRLLARDPKGPFGPGGIGISAFSPVLTGWVQGGPIAIHGTNDPASIGRAVSNGCLRIANGLLRRMFVRNPEGTPVLVHA